MFGQEVCNDGGFVSFCLGSIGQVTRHHPGQEIGARAIDLVA